MSEQPIKKRGRPVGPEKPPREVLYRRDDAQRPAVWKSGPDQLRHDIYNAYLKRRAQANFRKEGWTMDFEQFYDLWHQQWHLRGRLSHQVCMSRRDTDQPWSRENTYIRSRYEQLLEQAQKRIGQGRKQRARRDHE